MAARTPSPRSVGVAIGGLDPSAGAGILADVRAMDVAGLWGCGVCAVLTVQSTRGLRRAQPVASALLRAQLEELLGDVTPAVLKCGALGSAANAREVMRLARQHPTVPLIVDPVLRPSRTRDGDVDLFAVGELDTLRRLAGHATVLTPNVPEAEVLLGGRIETRKQGREAARALLELGAAAVLLKGGHLVEERATVVDWLATADTCTPLTHRRAALPEVHGTGCVLASLLAGRLAAMGASSRGPSRRTGTASPSGSRRVDDERLIRAARWATRTLGRLMRTSQRIGRGMHVMVVNDH